MSRYSDLINRAQQGECILIDGATGTEVERRESQIRFFAF